MGDSIMSTRTQIEFITVYANETPDKRTVYRHCDGYPSAMIPDLLHFIRWNGGRNHDAEYTAANWIYWNKRNNEENYLNLDYDVKRRGHITWNSPDVENDHNNILKIGHGVCINDEYHRDIEYLYKVIDAPDETTIEVYAVDGGYNDNPLEFRLLGKVYVISELIGLSNEKIDSITKEFLQSIHADDD